MALHHTLDENLVISQILLRNSQNNNNNNNNNNEEKNRFLNLN